jgi:hypothetical protein
LERANICSVVGMAEASRLGRFEPSAARLGQRRASQAQSDHARGLGIDRFFISHDVPTYRSAATI